MQPRRCGWVLSERHESCLFEHKYTSSPPSSPSSPSISGCMKKSPRVPSPDQATARWTLMQVSGYSIFQCFCDGTLFELPISTAAAARQQYSGRLAEAFPPILLGHQNQTPSRHRNITLAPLSPRFLVFIASRICFCLTFRSFTKSFTSILKILIFFIKKTRWMPEYSCDNNSCRKKKQPGRSCPTSRPSNTLPPFLKDASIHLSALYPSFEKTKRQTIL